MSELDTETTETSADGDGDIFEYSNCGDVDSEKVITSDESPYQGQRLQPKADTDNEKPAMKFTEEQVNTLLSRLPEGVRKMFETTTGMLYVERYESFVLNKWPYDVKKGNLCHPRALALAGLGFYSLEPSPAAQCQICLHIFRDLEANSNPWILHQEACPDCLLVSLGQRDDVDDYTADQVIQMAVQKVIKVAEVMLQERDETLKKQLSKLMKVEKTRTKQPSKKAK